MTNDELYKALSNVPLGKDKSRERILIELYICAQGISQKQLVETLNMRSATVSEQIDALEIDGLVEKHIDFMDKRVSIVSLTNEGKQVSRSLAKEYNDSLERMFSKLLEYEKESLYTLLNKINPRK